MEHIDSLISIKETPKKPLTPGMMEFIGINERRYANFASRLPNGHKVGGKFCKSCDEATGPEAATWIAETFKPYLIFLARRRGLQPNRKICMHTFIYDVGYLLSH
ncbi:hypothetical protein CspHIS471_0600330 [Cutaneotrichosporon sp. HIS471]|nr:hypothetical protein CspHIS471_0600330 [Cutaneotrichosporon sp. HIS471]